MGHQMNVLTGGAVLALVLAAAVSAQAQSAPETAQQTARVEHPDSVSAGFLPSYAVGADLFASTDADLSLIHI